MKGKVYEMRIKHDDLVKLVKELNELLGKPSEAGGYFNDNDVYVSDVAGSIKLYHGGVPGYMLMDVNERGGVSKSPYTQNILWARISTKEMYCFLTGLINGLKAKKN